MTMQQHIRYSVGNVRLLFGMFLFSLSFFHESLLVNGLPLYDGTNDVEVFESDSDFEQKVTESDSIWLIHFYKPSNPKCEEYSNSHTQIASLLRGVAKVGAVNVDVRNDLARGFGIDKSYPSIQIFKDDKENPVEVQEGGTNAKIGTQNHASIVVTQVMQAMQEVVQGRANGLGKPQPNKKKKKNNSSSNSKQETKNDGKKKKGPSKVIKLTASNIAEKVYDSDDVFLVAFAAPWCGHCKKLQPEWEEAAEQLHGSGASLGWVDATAEKALSDEYQVDGFPTIKVFPGGKGKSSSSTVEYEGNVLHSTAIVENALNEIGKTGTPKEIPELISEEVFQETCKGIKICVLFALPHILDSGAEGRNKYRNMITATSKAVRGMAFEFAWFEGGSQSKLEQAFELTFGFPAVAAYSPSKGVYTVARSSFTETNIRKFLLGITAGRQSTLYKIPFVPKINTVEPWDGKDGVPFEEEPLDAWDDDDDEVEAETPDL